MNTSTPRQTTNETYANSTFNQYAFEGAAAKINGGGDAASASRQGFPGECDELDYVPPASERNYTCATDDVAAPKSALSTALLPIFHLKDLNASEIISAIKAKASGRSEVAIVPPAVRLFAEACIDHHPSLPPPRSIACHVVDRMSGAVTKANADARTPALDPAEKKSFGWIDLDIEVPSDLHDVDDFRDALMQCLPQLIKRNSIPETLTPEILVDSVVAECRAFAPDPDAPSILRRERIFAMMVDGFVITAHDGKSRFLERRLETQTRRRPTASMPEITPGEFYLDLYERSLTVNRRVIQHLEDTEISDIKKELSKAGQRLSEDTVRTKIPQVSTSLDHVSRKLNEESAGFSGLLRFIDHGSNPEVVFGERRNYTERVLRIKQDIAELAGRIDSMAFSVAQAKDSNIALLSMQEGGVAKKIAIFGLAAVPITMAFAAAAIPECPVEWKMPMIFGSGFLSMAMFGYVHFRRWW